MQAPVDHSPIDGVIERLGAVVDEARARGSRMGFFPAVYLQMTLAVKQGIEAGAFDDGPRMSAFDATFAARYFDALATWQAGGKPTRAWRVAFGAAERPERLALQTLLVAINAHINLDLAVAAAEVNPGGRIDAFEGDFGRINDIIASLADRIEDALARFSPLLAILDRVGGRNEDQILDFSFREARGEAWRQAVLLAALEPARRADAVSLLDRKVALLGRIVDDPGGIVGRAVDVIGFAESDDVPAIIDALRSLVPPTLAAS